MHRDCALEQLAEAGNGNRGDAVTIPKSNRGVFSHMIFVPGGVDLSFAWPLTAEPARIECSSAAEVEVTAGLPVLTGPRAHRPHSWIYEEVSRGASDSDPRSRR